MSKACRCQAAEALSQGTRPKQHAQTHLPDFDSSSVAKNLENYPPSACCEDILGFIEQVKHEWETTADALPQIVCLLDSQGRILRANRALERWGLGSVAEVKGRSFHDLLHPGCSTANCYLDGFWQRTLVALHNGEYIGCQAEDPILKRHLDLQVHMQHVQVGDRVSPGNHFAVAVVADITELKAGEKALKALTGSLERQIETRTAQLQLSYSQLREEINERRRTETALRASREEYRQLVELMNDGLAVLDIAGSITYANERIAKMLGYAREEIVGRLALEFVDPSCHETWDRQMRGREHGQMDTYQLTLKARNGQRVWVHISPSLLYDLSGKHIGSFAVLTDISDRVRTEQALKASEHELRLLSSQVLTMQETERQRIASELHDGLGQTLSAIKFSLENTLTQVRQQPSEKGLAQFESLIPRIQGAVEEVRRISMDLRPSLLDDIGILATLSWFCRELQEDYAGITVTLQAKIREEDIIKPLKLIIFRIVQEALNNVVKHARTDSVSIQLSQTKLKTKLEIIDHGVGFDPAEVATKRSRRKGGAGLLSMRERAEYSGGRFRVTSGKGKGTQILIVWPKTDAEH
jgi:PAS domain S-box-containing protein